MTQRLFIEVPTRALATSNAKSVNRATGRIFDRHKGKAAYVATVRVFAEQAAAKAGWKVTREPVWVSFEFVFARPSAHYGTGKNANKLKPSAPKWPTVRNADRTNCLKSTEDALTGIVWVDDAQVVEGPIRKAYGTEDVIRISVCELNNAVEP